MVKESQYLLLKGQNDKKTGRVFSSFPVSASHPLLTVKFLLNRSNCTKRKKSKFIKSIFLSVLESMTGRFEKRKSIFLSVLESMTGRLPYLAKESIHTLCCSFTSAIFKGSIPLQKRYTRYRLYDCEHLKPLSHQSIVLTAIPLCPIKMQSAELRAVRS